MKINWKIKSLVYSIIDMLKLYSILFFIQNRVTKRSRIKNVNMRCTWDMHLNIIKKHSSKSLKESVLFEFGAGKSLIQNLYLSQYFRSQILVDLYPMINLPLVNNAVQILNANGLLSHTQNINSVADLNSFRISYKAPYDAENTDFDESFFDICISTNTLEHIPKASIINIFTELKRILNKNALLSLKIDYSDHYSHTDTKITPLNFLQYSEKEWDKYNHSAHFQNRLRHSDFRDLFLSLNFLIIEDLQLTKFDDINVKLHTDFLGRMDANVTSGYFLLRNNK